MFWQGNDLVKVLLDRNGVLKDKNAIFVFGSNTEGRHGRGTALIARNHFGAIYGQASGLMGNAYGLVTKDLSRGKGLIAKSIIKENIQKLFDTAKQNPHLKFYIAYQLTGSDIVDRGQNLSGYSNNDFVELFTGFNDIPENIIFHKGYEKILEKGKQMQEQDINSLKERALKLLEENGDTKGISEREQSTYDTFGNGKIPFLNASPNRFSVVGQSVTKDFASVLHYVVFALSKIKKDDEALQELEKIEQKQVVKDVIAGKLKFYDLNIAKDKVSEEVKEDWKRASFALNKIYKKLREGMDVEKVIVQIHTGLNNALREPKNKYLRTSLLRQFGEIKLVDTPPYGAISQQDHKALSPEEKKDYKNYTGENLWFNRAVRYSQIRLIEALENGTLSLDYGSDLEKAKENKIAKENTEVASKEEIKQEAPKEQQGVIKEEPQKQSVTKEVDTKVEAKVEEKVDVVDNTSEATKEPKAEEKPKPRQQNISSFKLK